MISADAKGFTILEVLVAVIILSLAYVSILQNFSVSLRNIERIDIARNSMFENLLAFEDVIRAGDESDDDLLKQGEKFLEGQQFDLIQIASEDNKFITLVLAKHQ